MLSEVLSSLTFEEHSPFCFQLSKFLQTLECKFNAILQFSACCLFYWNVLTLIFSVGATLVCQKSCHLMHYLLVNNTKQISPEEKLLSLIVVALVFPLPRCPSTKQDPQYLGLQAGMGLTGKFISWSFFGRGEQSGGTTITSAALQLMVATVEGGRKMRRPDSVTW